MTIGSSMAIRIQDHSDAELLSLVAQRDRDAYEELFRRYQTSGYNLALRITSSSALAQEALQDGMLVVWKAAASFSTQGNAHGWILKIVACSSLKAWKRARRLGSLESEASARAGREPVVEPAAERSELSVALGRCVARLGSEERRLLALYFGADLTCEEIGQELAMPTRTVSYKVSRVLERLRGQLSRSGFAAWEGATPLLQACLCSGEAPPAGIFGGVLKGLESGAGGEGRVEWSAGSARVAPGRLWVAGLSAVIVLSAVAMLAGGPPPAGAAGAGGVAGVAGDREAVASGPFSASLEGGRVLRWAFDGPEQTQGLRIWDGQQGSGYASLWRPNGGASGGYLAFSPLLKSQIRLPRLEGSFPFQVSVSLLARRCLEARLAPNLIPFPTTPFAMSTFSHRGVVTLSERPEWFRFTYQVTEDAIDEWASGRRMELIFPEGTDPRELNLILEGVEGVDDLEVCQVAPQEVQDLRPYRQVLAERSGLALGEKISLPPIPSARPPLKTQLFRQHTVDQVGQLAVPPVRRARGMSFDREEDLDDLTFSLPQWHWQAQGGVGGTGCLAIDCAPTTERPGPIFSMELEGFEVPLPARISCRVRLRNFSAGQVFVVAPFVLQWKHLDFVGQFRFAGEEIHWKPDTWSLFSAVVSEQHIDQYLDGRRMDISCCRPYGMRYLLFTIRHPLLLDDLKVEPLLAGEAVPPASLLEALKKVPAHSAQGEIPVPEIRGRIPGRSVLLRYYQPQSMKQR